MPDFNEEVAGVLESAIGLKEFSRQTILSMLETPPSKELGDIAFPVFRLAAHYRKAPQEIALDIAQKIRVGGQVSSIKVVGAYVNFFASGEMIAKDVLKEILSQKAKPAKNGFFAGKKIVLEYSQPNTNKPLHIGHLRNNALAMSLSHLLEKSGAKVFRVDLFNDRGIHICQSMLAYKKWGKNASPKSAKQKSDHFVGKYYVLYHKKEKGLVLAKKEKQLSALKAELSQMLLDWERGEKKTIALWKKMNAWAQSGFLQTYRAFGSKFEKTYFESAIYKNAFPIIELGLKKGVLERDETGAVIADLSGFGLGKKTVLRADGTSIYLTQDLALAKQKFLDFDFDQSVYVVASEQRTYFLQLFKILELLGFEWAGRLYHLSYGLVNLPEGRLKSREGKIVDADTLISDLTALALKEVAKRYKKISAKEAARRANAIALGAIKFFMLKTDPAKDVLFDPAKAISFEGDSGPYVMYSYARAKSILRKSPAKAKINAQLLTEESEKNLLLSLGRFNEILEQSAREFAPSRLCNYLLELSAQFNSFYHKEPVLSAQKELKQARLALVKAVSIVLANGLKLLNIEPLEQM